MRVSWLQRGAHCSCSSLPCILMNVTMAGLQTCCLSPALWELGYWPTHECQGAHTHTQEISLLFLPLLLRPDNRQRGIYIRTPPQPSRHQNQWPFFFFSSSWHHSALILRFTTSTPTDSIILLSESLSLLEWFSLFFLLSSKFSNCIKYCIIITIFTAPWLTEVTLLYYLTVIMHLIRDRVHTLSSICPDWQIPMT